MGLLFPMMFDKVVYGYTLKALPDIDIADFKRKHKKEYKAMVKRTPSVGSAKENMFAPVMYLACYGFSYYKADPEKITMEAFSCFSSSVFSSLTLDFSACHPRSNNHKRCRRLQSCAADTACRAEAGTSPHPWSTAQASALICPPAGKTRKWDNG